ncbi:MAG: hypothetical protein ACFFE8_13560 [Candidatus Heimdallarchaeota archaeon]
MIRRKLELIELIGGASLTTMKYIEDYCTKKGFRIIDASGTKLGYFLFLYKD